MQLTLLGTARQQLFEKQVYPERIVNLWNSLSQDGTVAIPSSRQLLKGMRQMWRGIVLSTPISCQHQTESPFSQRLQYTSTVSTKCQDPTAGESSCKSLGFPVIFHLRAFKWKLQPFCKAQHVLHHGAMMALLQLYNALDHWSTGHYVSSSSLVFLWSVSAQLAPYSL